MHDHINGANLVVGQKVQVMLTMTGPPTPWQNATVLSKYSEWRQGLIPYLLHTMVLEFADGSTMEVTNLQAMFASLERQEFDWCPTCRRRTEVVERDNEFTYEGDKEIRYEVTRFVCGHDKQSDGQISGRSPGGESVAEALTQNQTQRRLSHPHAAQEES